MTYSEFEIFDEVAYIYDGSLEGMLSCIFAAYANREVPTDILREGEGQLRLMQRSTFIETNEYHAMRVMKGLVEKGGSSAFNAVKKASLSGDESAPLKAYWFVRYVMEEHEGNLRPFSNIAHPKVQPLVKICRAVDQECEHMRQFIRFQHLRDEEVDLWYARCNPRDSVVPLIMSHFVERFNVQPFLIHDENHDLCGVYDGKGWYLVNTKTLEELNLPTICEEEVEMQDAWKQFYRCVSIDARYNPELRRSFMPKRFWHNLTELQDDAPALKKK